MSPIINLQRRLSETGRIRIGQQVASSRGKRPAKIDKFRLTSSSQIALQHVADRYGGTVTPWSDAPTGSQWELFTDSSVLDVVVPPEAMSYSAYYELWSAGGCKRRCNGIFQIPSEDDCVCDPDNRDCKTHTRLSIMLADVPGSGLWRLDTQGWNAANEIAGAFELVQLISQATGRSIVPGRLRLDQREVKRPDPNDSDKVITRKFAVPVLDFDVDMNALAHGVQQPALPSSGLTPIAPVNTSSLADEFAAIDIDVERKPRANAAEPVRPTGIKPRPRGVSWNDQSDEESATPATPEQIEQLHAAIAMLEDDEREAFKQSWETAQLPPITRLSQDDANHALDMALNVLNVTDEHESPTIDVESHLVKASDVDVPMISQAMIGKIRVLVQNAGVDKVDVHNYVSDIIHRQLESLKDLTKSEGHRVIDQLIANSTHER